MAAAEAVDVAREWLATKPVFLDTETTGLGDDDEICEIALLDHDGTVLLETLVKPTFPIPREATSIHGITDDMVRREPGFHETWPIIAKLVAERTVIIYNSDFDLRFICQSLRAHGPGHWKLAPAFKTQCAMLLYARYYGDWDDYHQSYTWQNLEAAARQCRLPMPQDLHRARADAELVRFLIMHMADSFPADQQTRLDAWRADQQAEEEAAYALMQMLSDHNRREAKRRAVAIAKWEARFFQIAGIRLSPYDYGSAWQDRCFFLEPPSRGIDPRVRREDIHIAFCGMESWSWARYQYLGLDLVTHYARRSDAPRGLVSESELRKLVKERGWSTSTMAAVKPAGWFIQSTRLRLLFNPKVLDEIPMTSVVWLSRELAEEALGSMLTKTDIGKLPTSERTSSDWEAVTTFAYHGYARTATLWARKAKTDADSRAAWVTHMANAQRLIP